MTHRYDATGIRHPLDRGTQPAWLARQLSRADDMDKFDDSPPTRAERDAVTHRWLCAMLIACGVAGSVLGAMALEQAWTAYNATRIAEEME